ncbi:MAG TPA: FIST N-terminal domain-containing protein [Burkholderiaceae bacterium]|nr:FIST N-terminal domain-containing protein [Burkholderiaceae bacterium]
MRHCLVGHATHARWAGALALAAAQIDAQRERLATAGEPFAPTLGLVYLTDAYAPEAEALWQALRERWPGVVWSGTVGVGVAASGVEYFDEPALALMLTDLPREGFRVFSGVQPLGRFAAATALVHADGRTPDLDELVADLAARTSGGALFGGLTASRTRSCQIADGVVEGGLSGVAFAPEVGLLSRVTQGCQPVGAARRITACERNVVLELDARPALECLLGDLQITLDDPGRALPVLRATLAGLTAPGGPPPWQRGPAPARHRAFGSDVRVRHLMGLDAARHGVALADLVEPGMTLAFCQRDREAARRDLVRICAELRDDAVPDADGAGAPLDPADRLAGAVYVSCAGRGGPHFGAPSAELQIVRQALGDVPLVGFFAAGEIGHHHVYGYTGVLTVFTRGQ